MVGMEKGSLALHCLVMQLSGTVYATFKVSNSSKEQRKASNNRSTPNLWKRRTIITDIIQKVAYTCHETVPWCYQCYKSVCSCCQFVNEQRTEPMLQIVFTSAVPILEMFTCKPY